MNLSDITNEELLNELERRKDAADMIKESAKASLRPKIKNIDLLCLPELATLICMFEREHDQIQERGSDYYLDEDFDHYAYEEAATALYGDSYFDDLRKFESAYGINI